MDYRIKQIFLWSSMGIMAGYTRFWSRLDALMGVNKGFCFNFVTLGAKLTSCCQGKRFMVRAVGPMAGVAILCCGEMQCAVLPVLGHLAVTTETKGWLAFTLITGMRRTMTAMTGNTLTFGNRFVLYLMPAHFGLNFRMTIKTDLPWLLFNEIGLVGAVTSMTYETFAFGKRRMGCFFPLFAPQRFMAG